MTTMKSSRVLLSGLRFAASALLAATSLAGVAHAQVKEPNGIAVPVQTSSAEIGVVTGRGFPADAVTLAGLFKYRQENISPTGDARTAPGAFSPLCGFTGQMMVRGGGCQLDFAWYNAKVPPMKPAANELYVLIPHTAYTAANGYACMPTSPGDFCPLATHMTTQPQNTWKDITYPADNIRTDPRYQGGLVGFAIIGRTDDPDPKHGCTETHYSQNELNQTDQAWIAALMWQSVKTPDSFYIGFEDWPMSAANWASGANDGDFNDFVFFVSGITCKGAGQPCTVPGAVGACAAGKTDCDASGNPTVCRSTYTPHAELCDNLDNDCNGTVDDGPGLCPNDKVCDHGQCINNCTSGEFPCAPGFACKDGFCIDKLCAPVTCPMGQVCQAGQCIGACDGVVCPTGQSCQLGRCIDPCAGVTCMADASGGPAKVCEQGVCVSDCSCRGCDTGFVCALAAGPLKGTCVPQGCDPNPCPTGQICQAGGQCADPCAGNVHCPGAAACMNGQCGDPQPGVPPVGTSGGDTGGVTGIGNGGATGGVVVTAGGSAGSSAGSSASDTTTSSATDPTSGVRARSDSQPSGCSCRTAGADGSRGYGAAGLAALLGLVIARSRGRRSRRDRSTHGA
jgi:MYXO-CTERM domain-containing protein